MEPQSPTPVIRDLPWGPWFLGLLIGSFGALILHSTVGTADTTGWVLGAVLCGGGLLLFALYPVLTVLVDQESGLLNLTYRSLLTRKVKQIPLQQIDSIDIEGYGVVIMDRNGRATRLRTARQSPAWRRRVAARLREAVGVGGSDGAALRMLTGQDESINQQIRRRQEELTGPNDAMRETAGVHWNLQSVGMGRQPATHWFSPDVNARGTFVYLAQIPAQKSSSGGLFTRGVIGKLAARASLALYGFAGEDLPDSNQAKLLPLDPPLDSHFMGLSPDPSVARKILSPRVADTLDDWAAGHPVKTVQTGNASEQLVVLFSPRGLYVATLGLVDPSRLAELTAIGVELVKAQNKQAR